VTALVLVAGFLGAGKTRTLAELAPRLSARGWHPAIVLHDVRNARLDGERLRRTAATVLPITLSCPCCDGRDSLLDLLAELPVATGRVVLVECSGTTDTELLLGALTVDRRLQGYTPPLQLTVVDAARWQQRHWHDAVERAQVRTASHLLLNWQERADATGFTRVLADLATLAPSAPLLTVDALVDRIVALASAAERLPGARSVPIPDPREGRADPDHLMHHVASFDFPLPRVISRASLAAAVRDLPSTVVRVKGLAVFDDDPSVAWIWHRLDDTGELLADPIGPSDLAPIGFCIGGGERAADIVAGFAALGR